MFRKMSISDIHKEYLSGKLDPLDVARECISRNDKLDPTYKAWVCFDRELLIQGAEHTRVRLAEKRPLRPLEGIPLGVKDIFNTADFPTQMGSPLWKEFTPGNDARVVYYLKNAGGIVAGKTVTAEFAVHTLNATLNPHDPSLTPGTSSSGSAVAVALGMVPVAIGTQTAGSIIRPASFCGVYGCKPSFGLIPRTGTLKTTDSLDSIGYFVSRPDDLRTIFDVIRVHGPNFPISHALLKNLSRQSKPSARPWRVGFAKTHTWEFAPDYARQSLLELISKLASLPGIEISEVELPVGMQSCHTVHATIYNKTLSYYFSEEYNKAELVSPIMNGLIEEGMKISTTAYYEALNHQEKLIDSMDRFFSGFDVLISLSTSGCAPLRNESELPDPALMWTLTHLPVISAPVFSSPAGLPFGLQLVARKYNDYLLFECADFLRSSSILPPGANPISLG